MFKTTKNVFKNEDGEYTSYGIAVTKDGYERIILSDISPNGEFVNSITEKCNAFDADPDHVVDIVYDSLE